LRIRDTSVNPKYPLYIVSKGRWESRYTHKALTRMRIHHHIVVEEQELEKYAAVVSEYATLLVLDKQYQLDYDACDDLGMSKSKGPGPARNFVWDHALANGAKWHWVMDDNIACFYVFNHNAKIPAGDGTMFLCMEDFCERYENVAMAGPNYAAFAPRKRGGVFPPFLLNTRIYSCNLIRCDAPYRWRGRYNEDTDLSLRMLKDGWCTVQFYAFLQNKLNTQQVKGGNTAEFYAKEGTLPKSAMQVKLHPDVSRLTHRYGRIHHYVDYKPFQSNKLKKRKDLGDAGEVKDYGMRLIELEAENGSVDSGAGSVKSGRRKADGPGKRERKKIGRPAGSRRCVGSVRDGERGGKVDGKAGKGRRIRASGRGSGSGAGEDAAGKKSPPSGKGGSRGVRRGRYFVPEDGGD